MNNLLVEIGTEEIPAGYIKPALSAFSSMLLQKLDKSRLDHGNARTFGTPKKLAVIVENVIDKQKTITTEVVGPPEKIAYDEKGRPTKAAEKFAEKVGASVKDLKTKKTDKGLYLCAKKTEPGLPAVSLLKDILPQVILSIPFPKTMKWSDLHIEFARPIHTITALLGSNVIGFNLGNVKSDRHSYGHRFMHPGKVKLADADEYINALRSARVIVDIEERRTVVEKDIVKAAKKLNGSILPDEELLDIVTNLVEYPAAVGGQFDKEFLDLPDEVLITSMREHQKYFAVTDKNGKLMPCFVAVNNTVAKDLKLVARGHERVLRARLADAQFFYKSDLEATNEERVNKLKRVLFQTKLGTMYEKIGRVGKMAEYIAIKIDLGLDTGEQGMSPKEQAIRAAKLCKADLVSQMVIEFPKLQGIMGRVYAAIEGEPSTVYTAIEEHYRPKYSGGKLPETVTGAVLSIADKIDSVCGCFSIGLIPTGASDPYALRRQGIGIVQIIQDKGFSFSLTDLIVKSLGHFKAGNDPEKTKLVKHVYTFLQNRIARLMAEEGFSKDVIAAVVNISVDDVPGAWNRVKALQQLKTQPGFEPLAVSFKRVVNIIKKSENPTAGQKEEVNEKLFEHECEGALFAACKKVEKKVSASMEKGLFDQALLDIAALRDDVDTFFEGVMVMADNTGIRNNRLVLLGRIAALFNRFADFSKIST